MAKKSTDISGLIVNIGGDTSALQQAFKESNTKARELQSELNTVNQILKKEPDNVEAIKVKQDILNESIANTREKLSILEQVQESVTEAFEKGDISRDTYLALQKEVTNTRSKLENLEEQSEKVSDKIEDVGEESKDSSADIKDLGDESSKAGEIMKGSLAADAITAGLEAIGNAVKEVSQYVVEVGSDFEASMSQVAATMGMTADEIESGSSEYSMLESAAEEAGATTKYTASEAAEALNYLALAGYDADKAVEALPGVLTLAQSGGMDLAAASDMVTDSMSALGLETSQLDSYIDQMAKTSQKSNTSVEQLGEGVLECAGTVKSSGQSVTSMNAALGVLANNGIKGAEGGTHLRNVLLSLVSPTDEAKAEMDELGISVSNSDGSIRDINDIMTDLNSTLGKMSESERTNALSEIFNKTDLNAVNALLDGTNGSFQALTEELENCDGAAETMAETMNDNLQGKMAAMQSSLESVGIACYKSFEKPLSSTVEGITDRIGDLRDEIEGGRLGDKFDDLGESLGKAADSALDFAEKALPVAIDGLTWVLDNGHTVISLIGGIATAMVFSKAAKSISDAVSAFSKLKTALQAATTAQEALTAASAATPWGLIAAGVGLVAGGIATYVATSSDAADETEDLTEQTKLLSDEQQNLIDSCDELCTSLDDSRQSRKDAADQTGYEMDAYKDLVDRLYDLNEAEELDTGTKAEMKAIVEELTDAMPDLDIAFDEQTGHILTTKDSVDALIDSYEQQARFQAAQENLVEIEKELMEVTTKQKDAQDAKNEALDDYNEAKEKLNELEDNYSSILAEIEGVHTEDTDLAYLEDELYNTQKLIDAQKTTISEKAIVANDLANKCDTLTSQEEDLQAELSETEDVIRGNADAVDDNTASLEGNAAALENESSALETTAETLETVAYEYGDKTYQITQDTVDEINAINQTYDDALAERTEELQNTVDLFSQFSGGTVYSAQDLIDNLNSQKEGIANWADNIQTLAKKGISSGLLQELEDAGPSSANLVKAMCDMTDTQLQNYSDTWEETYNGLGDIAANELAGLKQENQDYINSIFRNIDENGGKIEESAGNAAAQTGAAIRQKLDQCANVVADAGYNIGANIVDGMTRGMNEFAQQALNAAGSIADNIQSIVESRLGIESPSKVFKEIGGYTMEGLKEGLESGAGDVYSSMREISGMIIDTGAAAGLQSTAKTAGAAARRIVTNDSRAALSGAESAAGIAGTVAQAVRDGMANISGQMADSLPETATFCLVVDGKTLGKVSAPYLDVINGSRLKLVERGVTNV